MGAICTTQYENIDEENIPVVIEIKHLGATDI